MEALADLDSVVTPEMNLQLTKACSYEDLKGALFEMDPMSSPGPDGFSAGFYQDHWEAVGDGVVEVVKEIFKSKRGIEEINETFIVLIPKKRRPNLVTEYRPISLCNVIYKVFSKVLANRIKTFLSKLISPSQSAFVPGRLISDNIIVAYEAMHSMKHRMKHKHEGYMAMKLDMSKVYNRLEWSFLEAVLSKMGFDKRWTELVMQCVSSVKYSLLVNGDPQQHLIPFRGLRQGDPLSPYLFILCTEVLGKMLDEAERKGYITGFPFSRGSLKVNHLFFADDSLLFCKANALEWSRMSKILKTYEEASGQRLNLEKSCIFKLPKTILNAINKLMQKFWWGSRENKTKTQWLPWKLLGKNKAEGGLGYRDFEHFNLALLAKQGWRLIQQSQSLAAKVMKAKYFFRTDFLHAKLGSNASFLWMSFLEARKVLEEGLIWRIGNREGVSLWRDKWIPQPTTFKVQTPLDQRHAHWKVSNLIDEHSKTWNLSVLRSICTEEDISNICKIPISWCGNPDKLIWRCSKDGMFTVKSAYHLLGTMEQYPKGQSSAQPNQKEVRPKIWKLKTSSAVRMFLLRATHESLPTNLNLKRKKIKEDPSCPICRQEPEYVMHALWSCSAVMDVWFVNSRGLQKMKVGFKSFKEVVEHVIAILSEEEVELFACTAYHVWRRRNVFLFEGKFENPSRIAQAALQLTKDFKEANYNEQVSLVPGRPTGIDS
ncbi:hypothetical protein F2P56_030126 [Juglans regia]|uniref:Reverse transcriptase domain-containing protein n=2 Tax=Juglans regia TaxID=51240 RepID=A0A833WXC7_JUGRE|nr:uncharacterized protein LOC108989317 [Juglans regia]KAF5449709.1 hypothetical protein F2P56_030126 [Juglans regia]